MKPLPLDDNGNPQPLIRLGATPIIVTSSGASAASAAVISATEDTPCMIQASADCHIWSAADPTATTSHVRLWAKVPYYFIVPSGHKIAVVGASTINILPQS